MKEIEPYNPLDKRSLGVSVADAILEHVLEPLPPMEKFIGAGIYVIYYVGDYAPYKPIATKNRDSDFDCPIYVGKAVPPGARKGGFGLGESPGHTLWKRLDEHAKSIAQAGNLSIADFTCRLLVVDDIWIPLGESLLIERFSPLWNKVVDGYGNHDPGKGRYNQQRSPWDTLHPGRSWAKKLNKNERTKRQILAKVAKFLKSGNGDSL